MDEKKIDERKVVELSIDDILPNRFQPRIKFDDSAIFELSESIKIHGVFQPIIVRPLGDKYEIIAGERRYKASVLAGKATVPAIIMNINDSDTIEIALIENVQRSNLTPIEEAISYKKILDMGYINQESLAQKLGKSQSTIANKLRLLNLDDEVQEALLENKISERHARSILKLKDYQDQRTILERIINERLTVRKTDEEISKMINNDNTNPFSSVMNVPTEEPQAVNPFNTAINVAPVEAVPTISEVAANVQPTNYEMPQYNDEHPVVPDKPIFNIGDVNNQVFNPTSFDKGVINSTVISSNAANVEVNPDSISIMDVNNIEQNARDFNTAKPVAPMQDFLMGNQTTSAPVSSPEPVTQPEPVEQQPTSGRFFSFPVEPVVEEPEQKESVPQYTNDFFNPGSSINNDPFTSTTSNIGNQPIGFDTPSNNDSSVSPFGDFKFTPVNVTQIPEPVEQPVAAPVSTPVASTESFIKDPTQAVNVIKSAVESAKQLGFNIIVNESDTFNKYQIVIDIDK